jgi:tetratricopeptide (TPR) repeat protein
MTGMAVGTTLVGRDPLIVDLLSSAEAARAGRGSIVVLSGEAGIGKTSVVRHVVEHARDSLRVSWGKCVADASAPPFWPWSALAAVAPAARDVDPTLGASRFELLNDLREQVIAHARQTPTLHVIEDLQWADVASVLLLVHLAEFLDAPLLILATLRTGETLTPQLQDALEELRRTVEVRQLAPLSDANVDELLRSVGIEPDGPLLGRVRARTGGNPLFVTELLRAVPTDADPDVRVRALSDALPSRVSDLVASRVSRLPAGAAEAVAIAAIAGPEGDVRTVARVLNTPVEATAALLDHAQTAQFLDVTAGGHWQFSHELIRDAIYHGAPSATRARHHAAVLEVIAADPSTPPPVLARHALAAQPVLAPERAVSLAAEAGASALAQHAYEEAIGWFTEALALSPPDAELLVLRGEAQRQTGLMEEARQSFLDAAELTKDPALLARAALGYADLGADLGIAYRANNPTTPALLETALAAQPPTDSSEIVALESRLGAELYFSDRPERARALTESAIARARRSRDMHALTVAAAVQHDSYVVGQASLDAQLAGSAQRLDWARLSGSQSALMTAHRARVFDLLAAGDIASMDEEIAHFRHLAEPLRVPGFLWWPSLWSAMRAMLDGRYDEAEQRAVAAFELGATSFPTLAMVNLSFLLFFLRREQGRFTEMEQATRDYAAENADIPAIRVALAFLLAEIGRADESRGLLAAMAEAGLDRLHDRNWPASWFQLARAAYLVGDTSLAATLLAPERRPTERCVTVSLATVCLGATDLGVAWLHHTLGDLDAAADAYAAAEDLNARIGARAWLAQARADHTVLLRSRNAPGDRDEAERLAQLVGEEAQRIGLAVSQPAVAAPPAAAAPTFHHDADAWQIDFAGRSVRLKDARGLSDVAYLLSRPGVAVSVLELAGDGVVADSTRGDAVFDERAKREIRARLQELDEAEADADAAGDNERAAIARSKRQELAEAVARDFGLGGQSRRMGDTVELVRKTVSTRIRRTIAAVEKVHPELGRHLERSIDTGAWCAYRPAERLDWKI